MDFYVPSLDGKYVAIAASVNGSEDSNGHIFEVATGKKLADVVPRVNFATAGGSIAWKADDSGFYYTRYPQGNERPAEDANFYQQIYFHKLGDDPKQDTYVIGKDFPRIAEIELTTSDDGRWVVATVANGDGGEFAHYVMDSAGHWTQVTHFDDGIVSAKIGPDGALYLLSRKNAPRGRILKLAKPTEPLAQAKMMVEQSSGADENSRGVDREFCARSRRALREGHHRGAEPAARVQRGGGTAEHDRTIGFRHPRSSAGRRRRCADVRRQLSGAGRLEEIRCGTKQVGAHGACRNVSPSTSTMRK